MDALPLDAPQQEQDPFGPDLLAPETFTLEGLKESLDRLTRIQQALAKHQEITNELLRTLIEQGQEDAGLLKAVHKATVFPQREVRSFRHSG